MQSIDAHKRNIIIITIIGGLLFLSVAGFAIFQAISRIGKVEVGVYYAPFTATVELNGEKTKNNNKTWLTPGTYEVHVSLDNFSEIAKTIEITTETENIFGSLTPSNEEGERIMSEHESDYAYIDALSSAASVALGENNRKKWPIIADLPISNTLFSLGYSVATDGHLILTVNSSSSYLDTAISQLKNLSSAEDPLAQYDILFSKWTNPLDSLFKTSSSSTDPTAFLTQGYSDAPDSLNLNIIPGHLDGDYYYTIVTTGLASHYNLVTHRAVLKRNNNSWQLTSTPQPIATTYNTPDTPLKILNAVNNL